MRRTSRYSSISRWPPRWRTRARSRGWPSDRYARGSAPPACATATSPPDEVSRRQGVITWGPGPLEPHHQLDLSWYAIHPIEMLYALMGKGCVEVTRTYTADADVIVGRGKTGVPAACERCVPMATTARWSFVAKQSRGRGAIVAGAEGYRPLVVEMVKFFETGAARVQRGDARNLRLHGCRPAQQGEGGRPMRLR